MDDTVLQEYLCLNSWLGPKTQGLGELLRDYHTPTAALQADEAIARMQPSMQKRLAEIRRVWPRANPKAPRLSEKERAGFLPIADDRYPALLKNIPDPPPWLFWQGSLDALSRPTIAIVGSRNASHQGLYAADLIAERLAGADCTIVSGLALGIDAAAHRGALRSGRTAAVLASGLDRLSPVRHRGLGERIAANGCLLSELPPATTPTRQAFPRRNRIISGLSRATVIVEAALPSGTLHTAMSALEQGRDVFALPWSVFHAQGAGCLRLLRDGATPITTLDDLAGLFDLPAQPALAADDSRVANEVSLDGKALLRVIGDAALSIDQLALASGLSFPSLLRELGALEAGGTLIKVDGRYKRGATTF